VVLYLVCAGLSVIPPPIIKNSLSTKVGTGQHKSVGGIADTAPRLAFHSAGGEGKGKGRSTVH
jgi:hypothetical protein